MAFKRLAFDDEVISNAFMAAKGDLISASANDTPLILTVGANGTVLEADSTEATGLKWGTAGTGDFKADGTVPMTGDLDFAKNAAKAMALEVLAEAPGTPGTAQIFYDSVNTGVYVNQA